MAANNVVVMAGNLTRDPESRAAGEGVVTKFGLAVNGFKRKDGSQDVCFIDVEAWGKQAEVLRDHARKGSGLQVVGELKLDTWEDKASGQKRSKHLIRLSDFQFTGVPKGDEEAEAPPAAQAPAPKGKGKRAAVAATNDDESIPF